MEEKINFAGILSCSKSLFENDSTKILFSANNIMLMTQYNGQQSLVRFTSYYGYHLHVLKLIEENIVSTYKFLLKPYSDQDLPTTDSIPQSQLIKDSHADEPAESKSEQAVQNIDDLQPSLKKHNSQFKKENEEAFKSLISCVKKNFSYSYNIFDQCLKKTSDKEALFKLLQNIGLTHHLALCSFYEHNIISLNDAKSPTHSMYSIEILSLFNLHLNEYKKHAEKIKDRSENLYFDAIFNNKVLSCYSQSIMGAMAQELFNFFNIRNNKYDVYNIDQKKQLFYTVMFKLFEHKISTNPDNLGNISFLRAAIAVSSISPNLKALDNACKIILEKNQFKYDKDALTYESILIASIASLIEHNKNTNSQPAQKLLLNISNMFVLNDIEIEDRLDVEEIFNLNNNSLSAKQKTLILANIVGPLIFRPEITSVAAKINLLEQFFANKTLQTLIKQYLFCINQDIKYKENLEKICQKYFEDLFVVDKPSLFDDESLNKSIIDAVIFCKKIDSLTKNQDVRLKDLTGIIKQLNEQFLDNQFYISMFIQLNSFLTNRFKTPQDWQKLFLEFTNLNSENKLKFSEINYVIKFLLESYSVTMKETSFVNIRDVDNNEKSLFNLIVFYQNTVFNSFILPFNVAEMQGKNHHLNNKDVRTYVAAEFSNLLLNLKTLVANNIDHYRFIYANTMLNYIIFVNEQFSNKNKSSFKHMGHDFFKKFADDTSNNLNKLEEYIHKNIERNDLNYINKLVEYSKNILNFAQNFEKQEVTFLEIKIEEVVEKSFKTKGYRAQKNTSNPQINTIFQIKSTKDSGADESFKDEGERVYENVRDLRPALKKDEVSFKNGNWYKAIVSKATSEDQAASSQNVNDEPQNLKSNQAKLHHKKARRGSGLMRKVIKEEKIKEKQEKRKAWEEKNKEKQAAEANLKMEKVTSSFAIKDRGAEKFGKDEAEEIVHNQDQMLQNVRQDNVSNSEYKQMVMPLYNQHFPQYSLPYHLQVQTFIRVPVYYQGYHRHTTAVKIANPDFPTLPAKMTEIHTKALILPGEKCEAYITRCTSIGNDISQPKEVLYHSTDTTHYTQFNGQYYIVSYYLIIKNERKSAQQEQSVSSNITKPEIKESKKELVI